jgi:hypothetical protein
MKYLILSVFCLLFVSNSVFAVTHKPDFISTNKNSLGWHNGDCNGGYDDIYYPCH